MRCCCRARLTQLWACFAIRPVFIKYNSVSGDAFASGYGGDARGVLFTPGLPDGVFRRVPPAGAALQCGCGAALTPCAALFARRQYGYLPLGLFD